MDLAGLTLLVTVLAMTWGIHNDTKLAAERDVQDPSIPCFLLGEYQTQRALGGQSITLFRNGEVELRNWSCTTEVKHWGVITYDRHTSIIHVQIFQDYWHRPPFHMRHAVGSTVCYEFWVARTRDRIVLVDGKEASQRANMIELVSTKPIDARPPTIPTIEGLLKRLGTSPEEPYHDLTTGSLTP